MGKLADVLTRFEASLKKRRALSAQQSKVFGSIKACRTEQLGASVQAVCRCGKEMIAYNSCRDRHCPQCQGRATRRWVAAQSERLLPVKYHHSVFTLPNTLDPLVRHNERLLYGLLFEASSTCMKRFFASDARFGGQGGFFGMLHTWGQRLQLHPHVHYVAACGSIDADGRWRGSDGYLFDVTNLSKVFRASFLRAVERLFERGELKLPPDWTASRLRGCLRLSSLRPWVVYTKETYCGPEKVVEYVGRYAHKVAISEGRIREIGSEEVSFEWKDYRNGGEKKIMKLRGTDFVRAFAQHVLPSGFRRIRYYGFWSPKGLAKVRESLRVQGLAAAAMVHALLAVASNLSDRHEEHGIRCPDCGELAFEADAPVFASLIDLLDTS